jgi:hypothetical protein
VVLPLGEKYLMVFNSSNCKRAAAACDYAFKNPYSYTFDTILRQVFLGFREVGHGG